MAAGGESIDDRVAVAMSAQQWVAVIDDHESLRASIVRLLRTADVDARGFGSAEEFLGRAEGSAPACAVVDVYLGVGLNGYELGERLQRDGRALPIVFMTAQAELPVRMQEDEAAVATCLRKPFSREALIARLAPMIDALRDGRSPGAGSEDR
jgi:FixJ family two-component response regulator